MPTLPAFLRSLLLALVCALTTLPAWAQELPAPKITGDDIRRALIWTGHFSAMSQGDAAAIYHSAIQSWQTSKGYKATDHLADEQVSELLAEGDKQRKSFGWAKLEDKSIGFSIGVPTKLVKFLSTRNDNANFWYDFEGSIHYTVAVRYGDMHCANIDQLFARVMRSSRPTFKAKYADGFAVGGEGNGAVGYLRVVCRTSGVVVAGVDIAKSESGKLGVVMSAHGRQPARSAGISIRRRSRAPSSTSPHRRRGDIVSAAATSPPATGKPAPMSTATARPPRIKREAREGDDLLTPRGVRQGVAAVYVVKAERQDGLGGGDQRARAADQLPCRRGSGPRHAGRDKAKQPPT